MNAFLTGSQVYGTPTAESDVDLVVQMSDQEMSELASLADSGLSFDLYGDGKSLRFGRLNIIAINGDNLFRLWQESTEQCKALKPVSKADAKRMFQDREIQSKKGASA